MYMYIYIYFFRVVCSYTNQISFHLSPARLHCSHCCNTIARLSRSIRSALDLPFGHTPYNIGNNNIV